MWRDMIGLRIVALTVAAAAILVGCDSSGPSVDRSHGIALLASEVHGPGTSLGDGLRVPAGAVLAGAPLPNATVQLIFDGQPIRARAWTAFLGVGGSPSMVAADLLRQAGRAGYPNLPMRPTCVTNGAGQVGPTGTTFPLGGRTTTSAPSTCTFQTAYGPVDRPPSGRQLRVEVSRYPAVGTWGTIDFTDYGGSASDVPPEPIDYPPLRVTAAPKAPTGLPGTGQRIGKDPAFVIVAGSAAILPTLPVDGQNWTAVIAVSGTPQSVYAAYRSQLRKNLHATSGPATSDNGTPRFTERTERNGAWRIRTIYGNDGNPDGLSESVELLTHGDQSFIRLHATYG